MTLIEAEKCISNLRSCRFLVVRLVLSGSKQKLITPEQHKNHMYSVSPPWQVDSVDYHVKGRSAKARSGPDQQNTMNFKQQILRKKKKKLSLMK